MERVTCKVEGSKERKISNFRGNSTMTFWCLLPQVTPTQWQKWKESFQEGRGLSMWDLNSNSASLSVLFESVVAEENLEMDKERNRRKMAW